MKLLRVFRCVASSLITSICGLALTGCSSTPNTQTIQADALRDTAAAEASNAKAIEEIKDDNLEEAERLLRRAIEHDPRFVPAHNNLGSVLLRGNRYYEAATAFERAVTLAPNEPEPHNNLGLVLETVGRRSEAIEPYSRAVELDPQNPEYTGNLLRLLTRLDAEPTKRRELIDQLSRIETRPEWRKWIERQRRLQERVTNDSPPQ
ncbi:MAG: tetratricopeptide repeat protein [Planctomycetota bacterium]